MFKKRKKSSRFRGSHTHARGFKKKARGKGHRGGIGMDGTGKRADHKKSLVINEYGNEYFGESKTWRKKIPQKIKVINLREVQEKFKGKSEIDLKEYKILGEGEVKEKIKIKASAASKSALEKVKKAGGEIIIQDKVKHTTPNDIS